MQTNAIAGSLRLGRIIADMAGAETIAPEHLVEAIRYREISYMQ